jgi:hypothetical protein
VATAEATGLWRWKGTSVHEALVPLLSMSLTQVKSGIDRDVFVLVVGTLVLISTAVLDAVLLEIL